MTDQDMMASEEPAPSLLLALPDPCLLAVLRCCAADSSRSLFNAARAHSRLHQAGVLALRSITTVLPNRQKADSLLVFLRKHGAHVDSIDIKGMLHKARGDLTVSFNLPVAPLAPGMQLASLQLSHLKLQLDRGFQDVLGGVGVKALKKLRLSSCELRSRAAAERLTAALSELPSGLQHLSINLRAASSSVAHFPTIVLLQLQQLTCLEIAGVWLRGPGRSSPVLQPLEALSQLADLRIYAVVEPGLFATCGKLDWYQATPWADQLPWMEMDDGEEEDDDSSDNIKAGHDLTASMLSGAHHLTRLEYRGDAFEPSVLAGKTWLQHFALSAYSLGAPLASGSDTAGTAELLSQLSLLELTHLSLAGSLCHTPPATAYSALTASSKLRHLDVSNCNLPTCAWQNIFPAGRLLPNLWSLDISSVSQPGLDGADPSDITPPDGSLLVSCCPALQLLNCGYLPYKAELLAPLRELSGLRALCLSVPTGAWEALEGLEALCQLTGLRYLDVMFPQIATYELLQLSQLQQLTALTIHANVLTDDPLALAITSEASDDKPVWRQLPRLLLLLDARVGAAGAAIAVVPWPTLTE